MFESWWNTDVGFVLTVVLHIILISVSVILTVHILLHKKDPKASLMWIALVWFAPIFGAAFYLFFGINRISRRAAKLGCPKPHTYQAPTEYEYRDPADDHNFGLEFHRLGNCITHSHRAKGNQIQILEGVETIHTAMKLAIESAEHSIALSTYIFKKNDLGQGIASALIYAKKRGVDVKVLLDGVGNGPFRSKIRRQLRSHGVEVQRFLHGFWPWDMPLLNLRNHRKLLIIDGKLGFTGSLNIGRVSNLETHFSIQGPVLKSVMETFAKDWELACGSTLSQQFFTVSLDSCGSVVARGIRSGPVYENERLRWIILGALGCAKKQIRILSPYFIPDQGLMAGLKLAALKGVDVEIILPKSTNYRFADWAATHQLRELLDAGCHIYRRSSVFDHSKLMTIDEHWALIGSSNWDARSLRLNFEFDMECEDPEFVAKLDYIITERRQDSNALCAADLEGRSVLKKLRDASARLLLPYL